MTAKSERKRIKHKIVEILKSADIPGIGQDVHAQRSIPTEQESLPVALVYIRSEPVTRENESPKVYQRTLNLDIEIQSTHDTDAELSDELDDLAQYVEDAMEGADDLMNMVHIGTKDLKLINDFDLINTAYETESNGSSPDGSVRLTYNIEYYTDEDRPGVLNEFKRFETQYNINGNEDGDSKELNEFEEE